MPELYAEALLAFLLLAGASYRFRHHAGTARATARTMLRLIGAALFAVMLWRSGTEVDGERIIRALVASSLAAMTLVLMLSVAPTAVLGPIRGMLSARRR